MFMLEQRQPHFSRRSFFCGSCSSPSFAVQTSLLGHPSHSLASLDETALFLMAARNTRRSWQKQACAHRRKCSVAPPAHHSASTGEAARLHEGSIERSSSCWPDWFAPGNRPLSRSIYLSGTAPIVLEHCNRHPTLDILAVYLPLKCSIHPVRQQKLLCNHTEGL